MEAGFHAASSAGTVSAARVARIASNSTGGFISHELCLRTRLYQSMNRATSRRASCLVSKRRLRNSSHSRVENQTLGGGVVDRRQLHLIPMGRARTVCVTHPFHPWSGRSFEFVAVRRTWRQDRVFFLLEDGTLTSLPTAWTDVVEPDVFVTVAAGRSPFRVTDLLALAELIEVRCPPPGRKRRVRRTSPHV